MGRPFTSVYFSPDRGTIEVILGFIQRAEHTLDVAVYSITHPKIVEALIEAHGRGVKVRVLTDKVQASSHYALDETLEAAGVPLRRDKKTGAMHAKYAVADVGVPGKFAVLAGSFNWTQNAAAKNVEHMAINRLKYVVESYEEHFQSVWDLNTP